MVGLPGHVACTVKVPKVKPYNVVVVVAIYRLVQIRFIRRNDNQSG
jgi:hypothetical protein